MIIVVFESRWQTYCSEAKAGQRQNPQWVGHKDGGILIGKVYGHLSNEHAQAQAARMNFGPAIVTLPQSATA